MARGYYQNTSAIRMYQTRSMPSGETESAECRFIQEKKDELLISMAKYFATEIDKTQVTSALTNIRQQLVDRCPAYVPKVGCC